MAALRGAGAQELPTNVPAPPSAARVEGRVTIPGPQREIGVPNVVVTVHRVGPDSAGPLDSTRTRADGRFHVDYRRFGSDDALYFAAVVYHGVAYFTAPLRGALVRGDDAEITVFDTTSHAVPLTVHGHHVVVGAPRADGAREVVEVYELSNDTTLTVVPKDSLSSIWSAPLPHGAFEFRGGQGDVAPIALSQKGDRAQLSASFGPGVKQLSYSYALPEKSFPMRLPLERQTGVLEVLLEEPAAQARAPSLRSLGPTTTQGRTFKRFLAQGALADEVLRVDAPTRATGARTHVVVWLAAGIVAAMLAALYLSIRRRGGPRRRVPPSGERRAESLVAAIAALDARRESGDPSLDMAAYEAERASLKARLAEQLAAARPPG